MNRRSVVLTIAVLATAAAGVAAVTYAFSGTKSTTGLDRFSSVRSSDGGLALKADIVAARIDSKYHPLPWIGSDLSGVTCPAPLPARRGASITCTGTSGGDVVSIKATVTGATKSNITWSFSR